MIIAETIIIDGKEFVRSYSDAGYKIHGGFPDDNYNEAIDLVDSGRTYTETDIPIEDDAEAEEILNILTGEASE